MPRRKNSPVVRSSIVDASPATDSFVGRVGGTTYVVIATEVRNGALRDFWMMMNPEKMHAWQRLAAP